MKPDAATVQDLLGSVPFLNISTLIDKLKDELPTYLARAKDVNPDFCPLEWWQRNSGDLPHWSDAAKKILLIQPSSAAAERIFSLLNSTFSDQQENSLQDYIEASLMLQYNNR